MEPQANHNNKKVINKSSMKVHACGRLPEPLPARAQKKTKVHEFNYKSYSAWKIHSYNSIFMYFTSRYVAGGAEVRVKLQ